MKTGNEMLIEMRDIEKTYVVGEEQVRGVAQFWAERRLPLGRQIRGTGTSQSA